MNVPCPRGSNCPGSTAFSNQRCYLSRTTTSLPGIVPRGGFWVGVLVGAGEGIAAGVGMPLRYETYECAACGAQVVFALWTNRQGPVCRRVWDSVNGS